MGEVTSSRYRPPFMEHRPHAESCAGGFFVCESTFHIPQTRPLFFSAIALSLTQVTVITEPSSSVSTNCPAARLGTSHRPASPWPSPVPMGQAALWHTLLGMHFLACCLTAQLKPHSLRQVLPDSVAWPDSLATDSEELPFSVLCSYPTNDTSRPCGTKPKPLFRIE